jgi:glycosyltransferase involved in cell wall biosynthesis
MSEHEGFAVPLVESMLMRVPVLAYSATAVPFTLGGAGVQFTEKRFAEVTETAHALATDLALRALVLEGQDRRAAALEPAGALLALRTQMESP